MSVNCIKPTGAIQTCCGLLFSHQLTDIKKVDGSEFHESRWLCQFGCILSVFPWLVCNRANSSQNFPNYIV